MKKPLLAFAAIGLLSLAAITLFSRGSAFAQGNGQGNGNGSGSLPTKGNANLPFWGLHGSSGDSTTFAGTTNNNPFLIKVNNLSRASFTNSGLTVFGNVQATSATIDSIASAWEIIVSDALSVGGNATFNGIINANGDIYLASGKAIKHPTSNASLTFDGFGNTNTIGLGYNINIPDSAQGLVVIPAGNPQYTNGAVLLGDVNPNGEILIALDGSSGGRLNIRGWEKKTYLINDGGEKITLDGVNSNSLWETTKGLTLATRSGATFTGNYHLNLQGNLNSQQYYQNDTLVDLVNLQTTVTNIKSSQWQNDTIHPSNIFYSAGNVGIGTSEPSVPLEVSGSIKITGADTTGSGGGGGGGGTPPTPAPSKSIIIDGGLDRITATSGTIDFVNTNLTTTGSIQSNSMTTANLTITDLIKTKSAEFDTLRVVERMEVEKYIQSDTLHALSSLEVNNSLKLVRDTSVMYAEMSTKDTAVALMLQKDPSAPVEIGEAAPPVPGEARAKLTVVGNTKLDGSVNVSGNLTAAGNINANCVTTSCLNVSGQTSLDSLRVSQKIKTARIVPLDGDSLIRFGNGTLIMDPDNHMIYNDGFGLGSTKGIGIGYGSTGIGINSTGMGNKAVAIGDNSIVIGSGITGSTIGLANVVPNSLSIGFNSEFPTLTVREASGAGTTGNVAIGHYNNPPANSKLSIKGSDNSNSSVALSVLNFADSKLFFIRNDGKIGIGTDSPQAELDIVSSSTFSGNLLPRIINNGTGGAGWQFNAGMKNWIIHATGPSNTQGTGKLVIRNHDDSTNVMTFAPISGASAGVNGRVGILNINPQATLDVSGTVVISGNAGIGTNNPQAKLHLDHDGTAIRFERTGYTTYDVKQTLNSGLSFVKQSTNQVVLHLADTGNVGIGTSNPEQKLDVRSRINVRGPGFASSNFTGIDLINDGTALFTRSQLCFKNMLPYYSDLCMAIQNGGATGNFFTLRNQNPGGGGGYLDYFALDLASHDITFNSSKTSGDAYGDVIVANGNMGIGITPSEKLDVNGNIRINEYDILFRPNPDGNYGLGWYGFYAGGGKKFSPEENDLGQLINWDGPILYGYSGGALGVKQGVTEKVVLRWQADGKIGIGTAAPTEMLDVIGTIRACEAKVNIESGKCPDFVFDNHYNLLTLKKRRDIILKNKHLLHINAGKEIESNGLALGEFSIGILQNLEEHELYFYEHDERIEFLENENKELKVMILSQKKRMDEMQKKMDILLNKN